MSIFLTKATPTSDIMDKHHTMKVKILVGSLFILHCALSAFHLNNTPMWDDEAMVVWFAKNYNQNDKIVGYDGANIFSYRNGTLINNELVYKNPPLDVSFASYVIKYIGDDDLTIRLSFAITGMLGLLIFLLCFRIITGKDEKWFVYSSVLLLLSVNYLLIEGNSRYYSLNFLFGALSLFATLKITHYHNNSIYKKIGFLVLQLIAIYFFFLSHYLAALCWWLMCFFIMVQNKELRFSFKDRFTMISVVMNLILFAIIVKYSLEHHVLNRPDMSNDDGFFLKYYKLTRWLFNDLNRINLIPFWSILLFIYLFIFKKKLISTEFKKMTLFSLVFIGASFLLNPQSTSTSDCFEIRYIYVVIPILYMWIGYLLKLLHENVRIGKYLAFILALIYINSTLLCYYPVSMPVRLLLPNFIKERIESYPTAYSESIHYINKNFTKRTKIITVPDYHITVFLRYVGDKIEVTNTLNQNSPLRKTMVDSLGMQCLYIGECKPEYIFLFGNNGDLDAYPYGVKDYKYIDTINVFAAGMDITRPEIFWHSFGSKKVVDKDRDALYILHD